MINKDMLSSDHEDACPDFCISDAGANCSICERFENTVYYKKFLLNKLSESEKIIERLTKENNELKINKGTNNKIITNLLSAFHKVLN